jgi:hypothetical protein
MISVITGDIINSRQLKNQEQWMIPLKKLFNEQGKTPKVWEIYRGDSFQLEVHKPEEALLLAIRIKASVKCIKNLDVRIGIGIGSKDYTASTISESNGEAFIHSGEKLESLKKEKQTLAINTPWQEFDREMNLYIKLALIAMDNWTQSSAEIVKVFLENPQKTQKEIAELLGLKYQSYVSERKTRASYDEIMEMEMLYREKIKKLIAK